KQKNLVFKAGLIFRFANSLNFLKQVIRSNKHFDRIYFSRFTWEFSRKPMPNVSIIWDLMPHLIDMFLYVNDIKDGDVKIDKLQGSFRRQDKSELADIKLRIGDEDAIFRISWFSSHKTRLIEVFGEKDGKDVSIQLDIITQEMKYIVNDEDGVKDTKIEGFYANNTIKDEAENFIHAIQTGTNDKNNAEDSLLGLEIIRKIEGS
ncbi:MAG: hypothetical protein KGH62_03145, partial [Candidatus Micrarchaeota archaeon]|nr:hypothetical protein [Candidatus Micrarchaeota archaeon]